MPLSKTGAELLFELISQRYERGATLITSNLPFDEWTETLGSERLTGALLDRITHHVNILEMNGDSYRLAQSRARKVKNHPEIEPMPRVAHGPSAMARANYMVPPVARPTLAQFCAAPWPTFAPPLTLERFDGIGSKTAQAIRLELDRVAAPGEQTIR